MSQIVMPDPPSGETTQERVWTTADSIRSAVALALIAGLILLANYIGELEDFGSDASVSLLMGLALGIAFERGRFCFFCIWRDAIDRNYNSGLTSIYTALAVGAIGYTVLFALFTPNPEGTLPPAAHIAPVGWPLVLAAFVFGIGMALSGACISGHIYRLAEGSLRAISGLVGTVIGFMVAFITWNPLYEAGIRDAPTIWLPNYLGYTGSLLITLAVLVTLTIFALKRSDPKEQKRIAQPATNLAQLRENLVRKRWSPWLTGVIVGLVGVVAYLRVEPLGTTRQLNSWSQNLADSVGIRPESLAGMDTLSGCIGVIGEVVTNNGWIILGLFVAALASAISGNRFKFESINVKNGVTALLGGVMLGWGAFTALGCTVGVLLSGIQGFALSGWVFLLFSFLGVFVGIKLKLNKIGQ
jgi:uncharacterized membrane protein YedE/YeeE